MILGLHDMVDALSHYSSEHVNSDGAWWILALDGILLIPLIFAVFFYPMAIVLGPNQYGKAENRVVRITRDGATHHIKDLNVSVSLSGGPEDDAAPVRSAREGPLSRAAPRGGRS